MKISEFQFEKLQQKAERLSDLGANEHRGAVRKTKVTRANTTTTTTTATKNKHTVKTHSEDTTICIHFIQTSRVCVNVHPSCVHLLIDFYESRKHEA